jgi:hypothetical protein
MRVFLIVIAGVQAINGKRHSGNYHGDDYDHEEFHQSYAGLKAVIMDIEAAIWIARFGRYKF